MYSKAVALKLHGVEVDIDIIKRKGDPLTESDSIDDSCRYWESEYNTEELIDDLSFGNLQWNIDSLPESKYESFLPLIVPS